MDNLRFAFWFAILCAAFALATFMTVMLSIRPANAQAPRCLPFEEFRSALSTMKQTLISLGMVGNSHVIMVFSAPDGQAWTIISVDTNGIACGMAAGTAWDQGRIPSSTARDA